jgi:hypothetical protein
MICAREKVAYAIIGFWIGVALMAAQGCIPPEPAPQPKSGLEIPLYRYENIEVVCYGKRAFGLWCKWKEPQK